MSAILNVYVRPAAGVSDSDLLRDASRAVGVEFESEAEFPHPGGVDEYFARTVPGPLMLAVEDDADPADIPVGAYRYDFALDTPGGEPGATAASAARVDLMRTLYDGLVATGRYTCTMVFDLERLLATNDPAVHG